MRSVAWSEVWPVIAQLNVNQTLLFGRNISPATGVKYSTELQHQEDEQVIDRDDSGNLIVLQDGEPTNAGVL